MGQKRKNVVRQTERIEGAVLREWDIKDYVKSQHWIVFFSTLLWGLAAHGYMFLNKFSWHDDIAIFGVGGTYKLGRWFLGLLGEVVEKYMGNVSVPWFNGILSLLFIAVGNMLLVDMLHLKRTFSCIFVGGMLAVFPSWTSTYAYMFTAAYYAFAVFLALLGVYLVWRMKKPWCAILAGALCQCLSLGIYQAYLPLAATVLLLCFLSDVILKPETPFWEQFRKGLYMILSLVVGIIFYLTANHVILAIKGVSLSAYQNIDKMGKTDIKMLINGTISAWRDFIFPVQGGRTDMYMQPVRGAYYVALIFSICLLLWYVIRCVREGNKYSSFFLLGGFLVFPICINLLYLMGDVGSIHSIMVYAKVMVFILPIVMLERLKPDGGWMKQISMAFLSALLLYVSVFYTHYANVCYLQAEFQQEESVAWMTSLVTRIESTEGYGRELPIAYLNEEGILVDKSYKLINEFSSEIIPYGWAFNNWRTSLDRWCGFHHEEITDISGIESMPEVQKMPSYPSAGSICIINGVIVVKF